MLFSKDKHLYVYAQILLRNDFCLACIYKRRKADYPFIIYNIVALLNEAYKKQEMNKLQLPEKRKFTN